LHLRIEENEFEKRVQSGCETKQWHRIVFFLSSPTVEPLSEQDASIEQAYQVLQRWTDKNEVCVMSLKTRKKFNLIYVKSLN
jgi:hypothetical protein